MAMRKQLAVGSIWTAGVRAGVSLLGLANTVLLARLLTPADFGLVAVAAVIAAVLPIAVIAFRLGAGRQIA